MNFPPWKSEDSLHVITLDGIATFHKHSLNAVLSGYCRTRGPWQVVRDNGSAAATRREVK